MQKKTIRNVSLFTFWFSVLFTFLSLSLCFIHTKIVVTITFCLVSLFSLKRWNKAFGYVSFRVSLVVIVTFTFNIICHFLFRLHRPRATKTNTHIRAKRTRSGGGIKVAEQSHNKPPPSRSSTAAFTKSPSSPTPPFSSVQPALVRVPGSAPSLQI